MKEDPKKWECSLGNLKALETTTHCTPLFLDFTSIKFIEKIYFILTFGSSNIMLKVINAIYSDYG